MADMDCPIVVSIYSSSSSSRLYDRFTSLLHWYTENRLLLLRQLSWMWRQGAACCYSTLVFSKNKKGRRRWGQTSSNFGFRAAVGFFVDRYTLQKIVVIHTTSIVIAGNDEGSPGSQSKRDEGVGRLKEKKRYPSGAFLGHSTVLLRKASLYAFH